MPKRKATKAELEYGIGEVEIEDGGIEPEVEDTERFTGFAQDEENDIDDDELIEQYHKYSANENDVREDDE